MASSGSDGFMARGGPWVLLQNALTLALVIAGPLGQDAGWHRGWRIPATALLALAAILGIGGAWAMGRHLSPYPYSTRPPGLIQIGIYAWVRHPLYGCLMAFGFGWAMAWSSGCALALALAHTLALLGKANAEEVWLHQRFPDYPGYAARTKRFIPGFW
jgi:protein-S-isoprenylcysteine O-methyltransferase Ste14